MTDEMISTLGLDNLSPEKRALFELLQAQQRAAARPAPALTARPAGTDLIPLTYAQARARYVDISAPATPANSPLIIQIDGDLDAALLAQSFADLIARHEILRTAGVTIDGQDYQRVRPPWRPTLTVESLLDRAAAEQTEIVAAAARQEAALVVDIAGGRPLRARLFQLRADRFVLLLTLHYFAVDGWSTRLLLNELFAAYTARRAGRLPDLPALPRQYGDYALWQRAWLASDDCQRQVAFWRRELGGARSPLDLPADFPRPAVQTYNGAKARFALDAGLTDELRALSRRCEVTLFTTLMAAFQALLWHLTARPDFLVGITVSNRQHAALEALIGNFGNQIPLRTELAANLTFSALLERTRDRAVAAFAHQQLPTEELIAALKIPRDPGRPPLCSVTFVLHQEAMVPAVAGLALELQPIEALTTPYELSLSFFDGGAGLVGTAQYNTDLFAAATIDAWLAALRQILAAAVANPSTALADLLPPALVAELAAKRAAAAAIPAAAVPVAAAAVMTGIPEAAAPLAAIWSEVLTTETNRPDDDFFGLGGDSLKLAHLMAQVKHQMGVEIPIRSFIYQPTLANLVGLWQAAAGGEVADPIDFEFARGYPTRVYFVGSRRFPHYARRAPLRLRLAHMILETLPYPLEHRLLAGLAGSRFARDLFMRERVNYLRAWWALLDSPVDVDEFLARTLYYGNLRRFRQPAWGRLIPPPGEPFISQLTIRGEEQIDDWQQRGRGVIVVSYHTHLRQWKQFLRQPDFVVRYAETEFENDVDRLRGYAEQLSLAQRILDRGGVVSISPDGLRGSSEGYVVDFYGRRRVFFTGFAELALLTGAVVLPLHQSVTRDHNVRLHYGQPLDNGTAALSHEERVESLMQQYVAMVAQAWREAPYLVSWNHIRFHLEMEPAGAGDTAS